MLFIGITKCGPEELGVTHEDARSLDEKEAGRRKIGKSILDLGLGYCVRSWRMYCGL
jgi:hypothetical protein